MVDATYDETEALLDRLREAYHYATGFDYHQDRLAEAGFEAGDIDSIGGFREIPTMTPKDLAADYRDNPPFGSMIPPERSVVRLNQTPTPHLPHKLPVPYTDRDLEIVAEASTQAFRTMGITSDDVVLNTTSFTPYPAGWTGQVAVESIGATHVPTGPGDTEEQIAVIGRFGVTAIYGFPSFVMQIAEEASEAVLADVETVVSVGEPFTAIEGYREEMIEAFGGDIVATDIYGLSEFGAGAIAWETAAMDGMRVAADRVFVEVVDPETGALVERGEKGELVITSLVEHSHPVLRMRTGDLTVLEKRDDEYVLPDGVLGRVDDMLKVKGVKVYPSEIQLFLAGIDGVDASNVRFEVTRHRGETDTFDVVLRADPDTVDRSAVAEGIRSVTGIGVDEVTLDEDFELGEEESMMVER